MRKLIYEGYVSADGYATDKYGSTDFFADVVAPDSPEAVEQVKLLEPVDTILLGAETYRLFVKFWPTPDSKKEPLSEFMNQTPKMVVSNSLTVAPWPKGKEVQVMPGEGVESVRRLKEQPGGDIVIWGSLSLTHDLLRAGLVDELWFVVVPVALGDGRLVFPKDEPPLNLELLQARFYESGLIRQHYAVHKTASLPVS
ncbi:dihydrofolate reductase family protein [Lewinella sp. IMCC34183]|uniref:dihydrofolate reductase family protein n=1 Tax=Lewinella sp. IMCC34183 TaxID=2248762 RepID=UPI000E241D23|nr:dihydrofolate reductase family protein [Lewinella sp. IMCC34183]